MRKSKKLIFLALLILIGLSSTSCVKRRLASLEKSRVERDMQENIGPLTESFYPDKIAEFSEEKYLKWFKALKGPAKLKLPAPQEPKKLTKAEMVEDFEYLFAELKENYPFFGVLDRKYDIDFLANHDIYLARIKACENDQDFIDAITDIMGELHNYHAKIADRAYVQTTLSYYSQNWNQPSIYYEFINLNRQAVRNRYDLEGVQSRANSGKIRRKKSGDAKTAANLSLTSEGDLAILKVSQMLDDKSIEKDEEILDEFLRNKHLYKGLVIDIRDNVGGNMEYWKNFLLPKLITEPKQVTNHMFFKDSAKTRLLLSDDTINVEKLSNVDITGIKLDHAEDLKDFAYYIKDIVAINPDESKKDNGYEGKIFLLVDKDVFSAAEGFASFIKHTELATIVGSQTGGDGITLGVINSVLPNSGLVYTYTNTLGYAPDGTINEENPTTPDIETGTYRQSLQSIESQIQN